MSVEEMYVTKRDGQREIVSFDKILQRIKNTGQEADIHLNYTTLAMKVIDQLYDGITTTQIDELTADQCASLASTHSDYNTLAGRIVVSNHQKNTSASFSEVMTALYQYKDKHAKHSPLVSEELFQMVQDYAETFDDMIDYNRDYLIDFFGFKTLDRAYMMKIGRKTVERPQHMWMRVAIGIHTSKTVQTEADGTTRTTYEANMSRIKETYDAMSNKYFTHATPTLFNAGTPHPQLSSCFLLQLEHDSIDGIYNTLKDCAIISKWAGGIGLHIHNVRATGSHIRGTNGSSNGIVPMLRVFNNTAKYVDQCVLPETIIYTDQGAKAISSVVPGITRIFNRRGNIETVDRLLEHAYDGPMVEIGTHLPIDPLRITNEHPVFVLRKTNTSALYLKQALDRHLIDFEWADAHTVEPGDWLIYPRPKHTVDFPSLSEDICYIYGLILTGLISTANMNNTNTNKVSVAHSVEKLREIQDFLRRWNVPFVYSDTEGFEFIEWTQTTVLPFSHSDFYDANGQKSVGQRWLFLPKDKTLAIIRGLDLEGRDGITKRIMSDALLLYLRAGLLPNFTVKGKHLEKHMATYEIINPINKERVEFVLQEVEYVSAFSYKGTLYDLQMTEEHNYLLEQGLVHNGGGKRNGSFAIYLEPWHADIEAFLQMRKNHGDEELKARDLFYALWIPDLFMERVKADGDWTLMCPDECPGLADVYGQEFVNLYEKYEREGQGQGTHGRTRKTMKARQLWFQVLDAQMETGTPYLLYKDAANKKSNQKNLGTIKSSNLCSEVVQYSDDKESAVCNLASMALPAYVVKEEKSTNGTATMQFDYEKLHAMTKIVVYNLNKVIDVNYYPTEKTERSNRRHRPIGLGVQGLADVFILLGLPFASDEAKTVNRLIFETMYHAAVEQSCEMAKVDGPYETFQGCPASQGILQFDMWNVEPTAGRYDWTVLKQRVIQHGLRNSLLLAPMPTASTSQILGYNECIEPITSNIYSRRTLAGEFIMANRYLMKDLIDLGLWNETIKNNIIANHGSVQQLDMVPSEIREKYKTVWEIPMRALIDMAADRGAYVCQSQSLNLWLEDPTYSTLTSMHFYAWSKGLKTGIYYLRRRGRHQAQQFTIEPTANKPDDKEEQRNIMVEEENGPCEMCSA